MGKAYVSPLGTAAEVRKIYYGNQSGLAQGIAKGYIGDSNGIARLIFGMSLPGGYTPINYLQGDGVNWINTGYTPTGNTRVKIICADFPPSAANACIFGTRIASQNNSFTFLYSNTSSVYRYNFGNTEKSFSIPSTTAVQEIDANKEAVTIKVNGNTYTDTHVAQTISTTYPIYLFALNNAGTATYPVAAKIYSCQIWENNTLVRDYIPCERDTDGEEGLFDLVNNIFYPLLPQRIYLIQDGTSVNENISNGWELTTNKYDSSDEGRKPDYLKGTDYIRLSQPYYNGYKSYSGSYQTKIAIDLSNYSKIVVDGYRNSNGVTGSYIGNMLIGYFNSSGSAMESYTAVTIASRNIREKNISSLSGTRKIGICVESNHGVNKYLDAFIYNLWLE